MQGVYRLATGMVAEIPSINYQPNFWARVDGDRNSGIFPTAEMVAWLYECHIPFKSSYPQRMFYFYSEEDRAAFLLRWNV